MEPEEQKWLDAALDRVSRATEKGVLLMLIRRQDAEIVVTNAQASEVVKALTAACSDDGGKE